MSPHSDLGPPAAPAPVLAISNLHKRFPGVVALDGVSFDIHAGSVHGLIGQNGAGKSTIINILSGMMTADEGAIAVDGQPVHIRNTGHAQSLGIATVYQELSLLPNLTVAQNVVLGREPRRNVLLDLNAMRDRARSVLAQLDLDIAPDRTVASLSLAERQMVEIAKSLANNPRILVLDEPTAPLGQAETLQLFEAIRRLRAQGVAILYVSHRFSEVLALCDVATILRNGRHIITTGLTGWTESRLTDEMIGARTEKYSSSGRRPGPAAVNVDGLYWGTRVRGVSFSVCRGEIVALTGLLGAGHNEIARLLGGDLRPTAGSIKVSGLGLNMKMPRDAVAAGIGLLTDERKSEGILPNRPLGENIAVASLADRQGFLGAVRVKAERAAVTAGISTFGVIAAGPQVPMNSLSGGNQQKALLARWRLADADVFVLVEPTRGVDVGARAEIYRRLDALARSGKAIILVSADALEVLTLADRILVVFDGIISAEARPGEVDEEGLNLLIQGVKAA